MSSAVADRPRKKAAAGGWWGPGPPPTERWPGVTIRVDDGGGKYHFDKDTADRACRWFPDYCSHSKGEFAGSAFDLLDYQTQLIIRPIFGWLCEDGTRRFKKAFIEIPKKNGKTQLIAGLALYMLLADREPGAEVYVAAADRSQAGILFSAAKAMVEANPKLQKRLTVFRNSIIRNDDPTAFFQVLSADAATKHGPNIHCLIIDELHAQPDRELFETLTRGVIARRQPLILLITTAGDDDESICYEEYDYAKRVLTGVITDDRHLPVIFELPPKADWQDPAGWRRVNPGLGITIKETALAEFALEAKNEPRKLNAFLRFHGNRWTNQATAWIPLDWWDDCKAPMPSDAELATLPCAGGLDLGQKYDLACFSLVFRQKMADAQTLKIKAETPTGAVVDLPIELNYRIIVVPFFWIPEDTMRKREKDDGTPYTLWRQQGLVTATDGVVIDYTRIYLDIKNVISQRFPLLKQGWIGYDPAFATDLAIKLRDVGGFKVTEVLQGYKHLSEPSQVFEALIKGGRVVHGGHRVLRNHMENVAVKTDDSGRIRPFKPKSSKKRIDGAVATIIGQKALSTVPDAPKEPSMFFLGGSR